MRIALLTQFFPPETGAGARRVGAIAGALGARHELCVCTLEPGYPDPARYAGLDGAAADRALGFPVRRGPAHPPHDRSLMRRAWRELLMSRALVRSAADLRPEVVLVSTPSMFLAPFAWDWARRTGARFAWDVRDLTWRYARESARTNGPQQWLLAAIEAHMLWILRRTDLVIAATEGLARVLERQGVPRERMITLANGVSRTFLDAFAADTPRPAPARPRVTYVGLMGYNHGIGILVEAARLLPHVDVVLVGDGPERAGIEARIREAGPANVRLAGYVTDPAELSAHYRASDVLVSHTKSTPILNDIVYPAKTYEYFATRRPVVYAGLGFAADLLREQDLAIVVPPGDASALAAGIDRALADPVTAAGRAVRARAMVEREYCREAQLERLVTEFDRRFSAGAGGDRGRG